jgi:hypothetical protein
VEAVLELLADGGALVEVPGVEALDRVDRRRAHLVAHALRHRIRGDVALGGDGVVEAQAVDLLQVAQEPLALAVRRGELLVLVEQLVAARVQAQVHGLAAEVRRELLVLELALLPPRGDHREASFDALHVDRAAERGLEPLRAQKYDDAHRARTFTVRPMTSSMPRSVS